MLTIEKGNVDVKVANEKRKEKKQQQTFNIYPNTIFVWQSNVNNKNWQNKRTLRAVSYYGHPEYTNEN